MRVYVSGPMTGYPDYNLASFRWATEMLNKLGGVVGVNPGARGEIEGYEWSDYMRDALVILTTCQGVALLDGWIDSRGANLEYQVARELGMDIRPLDDWLWQ